MTLSPSEVHLWTQSLSVADEQFEAFRNCLAGDELQRSSRFHFEIHRNRFIVARARLRQLMASYMGKQPVDLEFTYGPYGKPALADKSNQLRFNLSHSGNLAVYAISQNREVGIDVEQIRVRPADERIPEMYFSPSEVTSLRALPTSQQTEAFYRCWTRKEAYVKARAEGLSIPLDSFDVSLRPEEAPRFLRNGEGYSMHSFSIEPDYIGAIVAEGDAWVVVAKPAAAY